MNVAIGNKCTIYDYGAKKPVPCAVYQGIEFLKYVLNKRQLNREYETDINRGKSGEHIRKDCDLYFESCYDNIRYEGNGLKEIEKFFWTN